MLLCRGLEFLIHRDVRNLICGLSAIGSGTKRVATHFWKRELPVRGWTITKISHLDTLTSLHSHGHGYGGPKTVINLFRDHAFMLFHRVRG